MSDKINPKLFRVGRQTGTEILPLYVAPDAVALPTNVPEGSTVVQGGNVKRFIDGTWVSEDTVDVVPSLATPAVNTELAAPADGTFVGQSAKFYVTPSAGVTLTLDSEILIPSDSSYAPTFSKVLTSGLTTIVRLEWNGTAWMLTTVLGEY